jgi:hypothetical protein
MRRTSFFFSMRNSFVLFNCASVWFHVSLNPNRSPAISGISMSSNQAIFPL